MLDYVQIANYCLQPSIVLKTSCKYDIHLGLQSVDGVVAWDGDAFLHVTTKSSHNDTLVLNAKLPTIHRVKEVLQIPLRKLLECRVVVGYHGAIVAGSNWFMIKSSIAQVPNHLRMERLKRKAGGGNKRR